MLSSIAFLYDEHTSEKKYERLVFEVEARIAQKNLGGHVYRLSAFRDFRETLDEASRSGVKTFVVVGAEKTFLDSIMFCPNHEIVFGFVPVFQSALAASLEIPTGPASVDILSARSMERFDLGFVNQTPFFNEVTLPETEAVFSSDDGFRLRPKSRWAMSVRNFGQVRLQGSDFANPGDGNLELIVQTRLEEKRSWWPWQKPEMGETRLFFKQGEIRAEQPIDAFVDGQVFTAQQFRFRIEPQVLRVIVGKQRLTGPLQTAKSELAKMA